MALDFNGQVALVTGGARGIGFAIARHLGSLGAAVVLVDINEDVLSGSVRTLEGLGVKASAMVADVTSEASVQAGVAGAFGFLSRIASC
jgi:3-oxoacyl-[acyl-carrier protein] reductase